MDCASVRTLFAFVERTVEGVEQTERTAYLQHLESCDDCAAWAEAERRLDRLLTSRIQDIPVPPALSQKIRVGLARRRPIPKGWLVAAAASLLLGLLTAGYHYQHPRVDASDVIALMDKPHPKIPAESFGVALHFPSSLSHDFLQSYEILDLHGRHVAKLVYFNQGSRAEVLVLSTREFRIDSALLIQELTEATQFDLENAPGFIFIIRYEGNRAKLQSSVS